RLLGDSLCRCLESRAGIHVAAVVGSLAALQCGAAMHDIDIVLVDVMQGIDLYEMRRLTRDQPDLPLVALGIDEECNEVVRCGQAGFAGYISRDATVESMCAAMNDVVAG